MRPSRLAFALTLLLLVVPGLALAQQEQPKPPARWFIPWNNLRIHINEWGNLGHLYYDWGWADFPAMLAMAEQNPEPPHEINVRAYIFPNIDITWKDADKKEHYTQGRMSDADLQEVKNDFYRFADYVYAATNGLCKLNFTLEVKEDLLTYTDVEAPFWPGPFGKEVGQEVVRGRDDCVIAYFNNIDVPVGMWGGTYGGDYGMNGTGNSNIAYLKYAKNRAWHSITTWHEWLHQIEWAIMVVLGYQNLPVTHELYGYQPEDIAAPQWWALNRDLMRFYYTPAMWRKMNIRNWKGHGVPQPDIPGCITTWLVTGPFPISDGSWDTEFIDEKGPAPDVGYPSGGDLKWKLAESTYPLNLAETFALTDQGAADKQVAYANAYIYSDDARKAIIWLGGFDSGKAWLNGVELFTLSDVGKRGGWAPDAKRCQVTLARGWNRLLVKTYNLEGEWELYGRVTRPDTGPFLGRSVLVQAGRPQGEIASPNPANVPTTSPEYFTWEGQVADDPWKMLPQLYDEDLTRFTGIPITLGQDGGCVLLAVGDKGKVSSPVIDAINKEDSVLNNELNPMREGLAVVRYTKGGEQRDLVLIRKDILEPVLALLKHPEGIDHHTLLIGFINVQRNPIIVLDTQLPELPATEVELLAQKKLHPGMNARTEQEEGKPLPVY